MSTKKLLSWKTLRPMTGNLGRTTWWRMIRDGKAPRPIRISPGRVGWWEDDIREWQASLDQSSH